MYVSDVCVDGSQSNPRIMLIEQNEALASHLLQAMERAGFIPFWAKSGVEAFSLKARVHPHVVLMDLALPDMSGLTFLTRLARGRDCGIIVISDMDDEADRIVGLELGADDYMAKPPGLRELVARIRAVHRRVSRRIETSTVPEATRVLQVGPIHINVGHRKVHTADGRRLTLTSAEFATLEVLATAEGSPVSRDKLSQAALGRRWQPEDRSVDQLVFHLRQKLPADLDGYLLIQSIRGAGYCLRAPNRASAYINDDRRPEMAA